MGWLFTKGQTKTQLTARLLEPWKLDDGTTVAPIDRECTGRNLWVVFEKTPKPAARPARFIALFLLKSQGGFGWGYKDMDESMGPNYYDCPLRFFALVADPGGFATAFREKCRAYHSQQNQDASAATTQMELLA